MSLNGELNKRPTDHRLDVIWDVALARCLFVFVVAAHSVAVLRRRDRPWETAR